MHQNRASMYVAGAISIFFVLVVFNQSRWKKYEAWKHDMHQYYAYLPAIFIYEDLTLSYGHSIPKEYKAEVWCLPNEKGCSLKMSIGVAIMQAPFFLIGLLIAKVTALQATGYEQLFQFLGIVSSLFYGIFSVFSLRKLLLYFFSEFTVIISLVAVFIGTNYFFYQSYEATMSHVYSFFLFVTFLRLYLGWRLHSSWKQAIAIGLVSGGIVLIRPTNILLVCLVPLLWNVSTFKTFLNNIQYLLKQWKHLLLMILCVFFVWTPQFIYWKETAGSWLHYSYNNESFFWLDPKFIEGILSFKKGWLIYTPIMLFSIVGIFIPFKKIRVKWLVSVALLVNCYIIFSWWCWWYGGSFGMRPMIEWYALLAFPFAISIEYIMNLQKAILRKIFVSVVVFFILLNVFQIFQYQRGILHYDGMSWTMYKATFGRTKTPENYHEMLTRPNYEEAKKGKR